MDLMNHKQRMQALESAYDDAQNVMEKATIVDTAARLDRENSYIANYGCTGGQAGTVQANAN